MQKKKNFSFFSFFLFFFPSFCTEKNIILKHILFLEKFQGRCILAISISSISRSIPRYPPCLYQLRVQTQSPLYTLGPFMFFTAPHCVTRVVIKLEKEMLFFSCRTFLSHIDFSSMNSLTLNLGSVSIPVSSPCSIFLHYHFGSFHPASVSF